jgi:hypothetical protein
VGELVHGLAAWFRCRLKAVLLAVALVLAIAIVVELARLAGGLG